MHILQYEKKHLFKSNVKLQYSVAVLLSKLISP